MRSPGPPTSIDIYRQRFGCRAVSARHLRIARAWQSGRRDDHNSSRTHRRPMSARRSYPVKALGNRVSKSKIPAQPGVMAIRAIGFPRSVATHAEPCSGPK
jgi:hypothetical protein